MTTRHATEAPATTLDGRAERSARTRAAIAAAVYELVRARGEMPSVAEVAARAREHEGVVHEIRVLKDGFDYQARHYASLSTIAREITGTSWNGFLWAGLAQRKARAEPLEAEERKRLLREASDKELSDLRSSLPVAVPVLLELLAHIEAHLKQCDHTLSTTETFLMSAGAEPERVIRWLESHGGYCDCEVLSNVADVVDQLRPADPVRPYSTPPRTRRRPRGLVAPWGWDLASMPKPWRVSNLYETTAPLRVHFGKSDGCTLTFLGSPLPPGDKDRDSYWSELWQAKTDLDAGGAAHVDRTALPLPAGMLATTVRVPRWVPVIAWIGPVGWEWHIEARSEVQRMSGDLKEIAALVVRLKTDGR